MASTSSEVEPRVEPRSSFGRLFGTLMSWRPYVMSRLLKLKQCHADEKWTEQAVKTLVEKLRGKEGSLEELERVLTHPGTPSKCITISRSVDGRLQILHLKGFPHVTYCRVFRWPDIKTHHELQPLPECKFPYSKKIKEVCVNPYHYKRVYEDVLQPALVPKNNDSEPSHALLPFQERVEPTMPPTVTCTTSGFIGYDLSSVDADSALLEQFDARLFDTLEPRPGESGPVQSVAYEEQAIWSSIAYFELNNRVGEIFYCKNTTIIVDGYTTPDEKGGRFSIGRLSNIKRTPAIQQTRRQIGDGIRIEYVMGQVYVECLSNHAVYVQSRLLNLGNKFFSSTVCKVLPGSTIKIFDNIEFSKYLFECISCGYESVYELTKMCTIRIGFVKGWGAPYHRWDVTSTPTWIEMHLNGPLQWLDRVLVEMPGPNDTNNSHS